MYFVFFKKSLQLFGWEFLWRRSSLPALTPWDDVSTGFRHWMSLQPQRRGPDGLSSRGNSTKRRWKRLWLRQLCGTNTLMEVIWVLDHPQINRSSPPAQPAHAWVQEVADASVHPATSKTEVTQRGGAWGQRWSTCQLSLALDDGSKKVETSWPQILRRPTASSCSTVKSSQSDLSFPVYCEPPVTFLALQAPMLHAGGVHLFILVYSTSFYHVLLFLLEQGLLVLVSRAANQACHSNKGSLQRVRPKKDGFFALQSICVLVCLLFSANLFANVQAYCLHQQWKRVEEDHISLLPLIFLSVTGQRLTSSCSSCKSSGPLSWLCHEAIGNSPRWKVAWKRLGSGSLSCRPSRPMERGGKRCETMSLVGKNGGSR